MDRQVLRIFHCRPLELSFDAVLRDVMIPELFTTQGIREVHVGRRGPDELGERLVATLWESSDAMRLAIGEGLESSRLHPEYLDRTTGRSLEVLPVAFVLPSEGGAQGHIIRLSRGTIRTGELASYIAEAGQGSVDDRAAGRGAICLFLAEMPPDRFVTLSVWDDWSTLSGATGADIHQPIATRHPERIVEFEATHYEVLPGIVSPIG